MVMNWDLGRIMSHLGHLRTSPESVTNVTRDNRFVQRRVTFRKNVTFVTKCDKTYVICDIFSEALSHALGSETPSHNALGSETPSPPPKCDKTYLIWILDYT